MVNMWTTLNFHIRLYIHHWLRDRQKRETSEIRKTRWKRDRVIFPQHLSHISIPFFLLLDCNLCVLLLSVVSSSYFPLCLSYTKKWPENEKQMMRKETAVKSSERNTTYPDRDLETLLRLKIDLLPIEKRKMTMDKEFVNRNARMALDESANQKEEYGFNWKDVSDWKLCPHHLTTQHSLMVQGIHSGWMSVRLLLDFVIDIFTMQQCQMTVKWNQKLTFEITQLPKATCLIEWNESWDISILSKAWWILTVDSLSHIHNVEIVFFMEPITKLDILACRHTKSD